MNLKSSFWLHYITLHAGWAEWYYMESNANANPTNEWAGVRVYYMSTVFIEFIWKYHKVSYLIESNRKFMRNTNDIWCSLSPIMYPGLGWNRTNTFRIQPFGSFHFIHLNPMPKGKQIRQQQHQKGVVVSSIGRTMIRSTWGRLIEQMG